jgi:prepilin-type processing-associated H-X9-DG protein
MTARSFHPGGVNAALGDGSVRFFPDTINVDTWRALATTYGGETAAP